MPTLLRPKDEDRLPLAASLNGPFGTAESELIEALRECLGDYREPVGAFEEVTAIEKILLLKHGRIHGDGEVDGAVLKLLGTLKARLERPVADDLDLPGREEGECPLGVYGRSRGRVRQVGELLKRVGRSDGGERGEGEEEWPQLLEGREEGGKGKRCRVKRR
jgi:hypothetical protein